VSKEQEIQLDHRLQTATIKIISKTADSSKQHLCQKETTSREQDSNLRILTEAFTD
jgi:hypothetical protein